MSGAEDLRRLATYAGALDIGDLPAETLSVAKACLLYGLAWVTGTATFDALRVFDDDRLLVTLDSCVLDRFAHPCHPGFDFRCKVVRCAARDFHPNA